MTDSTPTERATATSCSAQPRGRVLSRRHDDSVIQAEVRRLARAPVDTISSSRSIRPRGDSDQAPEG